MSPFKEGDPAMGKLMGVNIPCSQIPSILALRKIQLLCCVAYYGATWGGGGIGHNYICMQLESLRKNKFHHSNCVLYSVCILSCTHMYVDVAGQNQPRTKLSEVYLMLATENILYLYFVA